MQEILASGFVTQTKVAKEAKSRGIKKKTMCELYTKSKTAPAEEERKKARQEYLDKRGIRRNSDGSSFMITILTGTWHAPVQMADKRNIRM